MHLDGVINKAYRTGKGKSIGRPLQPVRDFLDENLKTIKDFKKADADWSATVTAIDALAEGRKVFATSFGSPDELQAHLVKMAPKVRTEFLKGVRDAVSQMMGTARNDALKARTELLDKGWNREKLSVLLGPKRAEVLDRVLAAETRRAQTGQAITQGSQTAYRREVQKLYPSQVSVDTKADRLAQSGAVGTVLSGAYRAINKIAGGYMKNRNQKISEDAARLLTAAGVDRIKIERALQELNKKKAAGLSEAKVVETLVTAAGIGNVPRTRQKPIEKAIPEAVRGLLAGDR
jgi:hypothetical protein